MKSQKKWTKKEISFLIKNYSKYESYTLAEKVNRSKESTYNKLWRLRKIGILKQSKYKLSEVSALRCINSNGQERGKIKELAITF